MHNHSTGSSHEAENGYTIPIVELGQFLPGPVLGTGGQAVVYDVIHEPTGMRVALKVAPSWAIDHEATMLAHISHPRIVHPLFRSGSNAGRTGFLALPALRELSVHVSNLELPALFEIAEALDALHAAGIIHGDIKPENVMRDLEDRLILGDFSHALFLGQGDGQKLGTEGFIAPELYHGYLPSPASDLYSFAVMVYERLFGHLPELNRPLPAVFEEVFFTADPVARHELFPSLVHFMQAVAADPNPQLQQAWLTAQPTRALPVVRPEDIK